MDFETAQGGARRGLTSASQGDGIYGLTLSARLVGINPEKHFKTAIDAHLNGKEIPLPHEVAPKA